MPIRISQPLIIITYKKNIKEIATNKMTTKKITTKTTTKRTTTKRKTTMMTTTINTDSENNGDRSRQRQLVPTCQVPLV